jgi:hypothetical protein
MLSAPDRAILCDSPTEDIEFDTAETRGLDNLEERTRKCGISWEDLKTELGL